MLNTSELLASLTAAGLAVRVVNGNRLAIEPAARLTQDLRQSIQRHKAELLAQLSANDPPLPARVKIIYRLTEGSGGVLISTDGSSRQSNLIGLRERYGGRLRLDDPADVDLLAERYAEMHGQAGYD